LRIGSNEREQLFRGGVLTGELLGFFDGGGEGYGDDAGADFLLGLWRLGWVG
jgi:hypothetical protein